VEAEAAQAPDQLDALLFDPAGLYRGRSDHLAILGCPHNTG
jgi:hypothetical protein